MPRITISYRRDDSLDITGRIFGRLAGISDVSRCFVTSTTFVAAGRQAYRQLTG
ncbi:MAG TPA: hypothetical protein VGF39_11780 [Stellaceae bacterium]|jgi:hypothetical protein